MRPFFFLALVVVGVCPLLAQDPVVLMFAGDVTLSDNVERYTGSDSTYVFRRWKPGRECDLFMVNLEHPVTTSEDRVEKKFNFKLSPSGLATLKEGGVTLVNCANNHVFDYGLQGIEETMRNLDSAGITRVGIGKTLREARTPVIRELKGRRIGFLAYYGSGEYAATAVRPGFAPRITRYILDDVRNLKKRVDYVVVNFHWGTERAPEPDDWQVRLAHRVIDAGADLIVGHHPHVLQGVEHYKGKFIAYSLGNFVFGGNTLHTYDTAVLKVFIGQAVNVELIPVSVRRWQPAPAKGGAKERVLQLVEERSLLFFEEHPEPGVNE